MASELVLALGSWKARCWKHLHEMFVMNPIGQFYRWAPDATSGSVTFGKSEGYEITPTGFTANEVSVAVVPSENMRERLLEREAITWQVVVTFKEEVLTEYFDNELFKMGDRMIPSSDVDGVRIPPIFLNVNLVDFTHPPMHDATNGSVVRYTIQMIPGRI